MLAHLELQKLSRQVCAHAFKLAINRGDDILVLALCTDARRVVIVVFYLLAAGNNKGTGQGLRQCIASALANLRVLTIFAPAVVRQRTPRAMMWSLEKIVRQHIRAG